MAQTTEKPPQWFDKAFVQTAIQNYKRDKTIEVLSFDVKSDFGGHYCSSMFGSKIKFRSQKFHKAETEALNVVVKAMPLNEADKMKIVSGTPVFETETKMYSITLPAIYELFERSGMKIKLGPELIYATDKPFSIIMLKDLSEDGFSTQREQPEKLEDSKVIIQKLAQFHAASYFLSETNQEDFTDYKHTIYQNEHLVKEFFFDTLSTFRQVVETWDGYDEYLPRLDNFIANIAKIGQSTATANKRDFGYNVLNHGDFHMRNLLVKNNSQNQLESVRFIDFQLCVYCSPAVDINYMFGLIKRDDDGDLPSEEIIMFYHEEFVNALKTFGFMKAPPSLLDLNIELLRHGAAGVISQICLLPFVFIDWDKMSVEDFMGNDGEKSRNFKKSLYENPMCRKLLQREMKSWVHKGWL